MQKHKHFCMSICLQVLHQFCVLWFGDGPTEIWGESSRICAPVSPFTCPSVLFGRFKLYLLSCWLVHIALLSKCWFFQVSIYLMQIIFGAVDIPAKLFALGMLSFLGRRVSQVSCLILSAIIIFANIFVPTGKPILMLIWP